MSLRTLGRLAGTGIVVLSSLALAIQGHAKAAPAANPVTAISGLHVVGNKLANSAGQTVVLHGVNRSGTEYACVQDWDIFNGPSDSASVQAIAAWHVNAVRVPLNEDCWLSINGVDPQYSGTTYRQAIANYVGLLNQNGMAAILDLHWTAPGATLAEDQQPMADTDHSIDFWQSVAGTFKGNQSVLFDLFNEPYPDDNQDSTAAWTCWRDGGDCAGIGYNVAGMQTLVDTVRATGATNVIMLGGVQYSNALSSWLTYEPNDPLHNLAASWHSYNGQQCQDVACWNSIVAPVAAKVPLITGETGEDDCKHGYIDGVMNWLDSIGGSYLAWSWNITDDGTCHINTPASIALIKDYTGTPLPSMGQGYHDHLASLAQNQDPALAAPTLHLVTPQNVIQGRALTRFSATVSGTAGAPVPSGTVTFTVRASNHATVFVGPVRLTAGTASTTKRMTIFGLLYPITAVITVTYSGDGAYQPATLSKRVMLRP